MDTTGKQLLRERVAALPGLPTIPSNVLVLLAMLRAKEIKMEPLLDAVGKDQVLVAGMLKLINSGFYGLRKEITSIHHALNLLGVLKLKELLYSLSVIGALGDADGVLWLHSYSSFRLMEELVGQRPELNVSPNLPLAMLMHDLGKVVLDKLDPAAHKAAYQESRSRGVPLASVEAAALGVDHAEVGGWLLTSWLLDDETVAPIANHHRPEPPSRHVRETALVQLVDHIDCSVRGVPSTAPTPALMAAAGLEGFDSGPWVRRQESLFPVLDQANPAAKLSLRKRL